MSSVSGVISVIGGRIISVEKGNVGSDNSPKDKQVCAFTVSIPDSIIPIKLLLYGVKAIEIYTEELKNGKSLWSNSSGVVVNFSAEIKDIRAKEIVLHNPKKLEFFSIRSFDF